MFAGWKRPTSTISSITAKLAIEIMVGFKSVHCSSTTAFNKKLLIKIIIINELLL